MPPMQRQDQLSTMLQLAVCSFQYSDRLLVRSCEDYCVESAMMLYAWIAFDFSTIAVRSKAFGVLSLAAMCFTGRNYEGCP